MSSRRNNNSQQRNQKRNNNNNTQKNCIPKWLSPLQKNVLNSLPIKGEPLLIKRMQGVNVTRTTTVTTGVVAVKEAFAVSSDLPMLSTRYSTAYNEYMLLQIEMEIIPIAVSTGYSIAWVSSDTTQTPDVTEAQAAFPSLEIKHTTSTDRTYTLVYKPTGTEEMVWTAIGTDITLNLRFYIYTDTAFGAPTVATPIYCTKMKAWVAMRGLFS
jgi:hypothetical protein